MTENDIKLLQQARNLPYTEWYMVDNLIQQADTDECRSLLRAIEIDLYHSDEAACGLL